MFTRASSESLKDSCATGICFRILFEFVSLWQCRVAYCLGKPWQELYYSVQMLADVLRKDGRVSEDTYEIYKINLGTHIRSRQTRATKLAKSSFTDLFITTMRRCDFAKCESYRIDGMMKTRLQVSSCCNIAFGIYRCDSLERGPQLHFLLSSAFDPILRAANLLENKLISLDSNRDSLRTYNLLFPCGLRYSIAGYTFARN